MGGRLMKAAIALLVFALGLAAPAAAEDTPAPLFAADSPIEITVAGPIHQIERATADATTPRPATLAAGSETLPIMLSARGHARRQAVNCQFPPLLVAFPQKPGASSLFRGQKQLKLTAHCRNQSSFDRYVLREYATYRLYNALTPQSFKVRLARVRYVDGGKEIAVRWGFFIEDSNAVARRLGGKQLDVPSFPYSGLDPAGEARAALFEYLIGNLDWDMGEGPKGSRCCHNFKLVGATRDARTGVIPIPYDFDYSGLVDTPYAVPPEGIPVNSVRHRWFRGICRNNAEAQRAAADFIAARPKLEGQLNAIPQLPPGDRDDMLKYIAGFYDDIATPDSVQKKLLKTCR